MMASAFAVRNFVGTQVVGNQEAPTSRLDLGRQRRRACKGGSRRCSTRGARIFAYRHSWRRTAANSGDRCDVAPPEDVGIGRHDGLAIEVQVLAIVIAEIRYFK